ncbi:MAG TPA: hypothetical protein VK453_04320 [Micromonosporaceae bacterium]|nr:hypothetical protein [Micromonosporaceae bacterium]
MFVLKGHRYPTTADAFLALPRASRAAALAATDRVPLSQIQPWQVPRRIDELE